MVDFINFSFIQFPVFNIADIGVTVGMLVFFIALLIRTIREGKATPKIAETVQEALTPSVAAPEPAEEEAQVVALITSDGEHIPLDETGGEEER